MTEKTSTPAEVGPAEAEHEIAAGAILLDVRTQQEWDGARIPGAVHAPLDRFAQKAAELDVSATIVVYCKTGSRSAMAAEALAGAGYDARNLAGGIIAWKEEGKEIEPSDGEIVGQ